MCYIIDHDLCVPSIESTNGDADASRKLFATVVSVNDFISIPFSSVGAVPATKSMPTALVFLPYGQ